MDFKLLPRGHRKSCRRGGFWEFWLCEMPRRSCRGNHRKVQGPVRLEIESSWIVWLPGMVCHRTYLAGYSRRKVLRFLRKRPFTHPFFRLPVILTYPVPGFPWFSIREGSVLILMLDPAFQSFRSFYALPSAQPRWQRFYQRGACQVRGMGLPEGSSFCSDEIHCDLLLEPGLRHTPLASLGAEVAERSITLMALSKTYNLPGFGCSYAIISNGKLRSRFKKAMAGIVPDPPAMGFALAGRATVPENLGGWN